MRTIAQKAKLAAIVAFGVTGVFAAAPASAQPYDPAYDDPYYDQGYDQGAYDPGYYDPYYYDPGYDQYAYDDGYYGDEAYGYCDAYGCPDDYYDLPVYYGDVFYDNAWLTGPLYYRDWGGGRQFWIRGGWRSSQYRGGRFGPALGRSWYRQNRAFRPGFNSRNAYRGNSYRSGNYSYGQRGYGQRNFGQRDGGYRQRSFSGNSSFSPGSSQRFRGSNDFRSQWSNRQGFGQSGFDGGRQRGFQSQQQPQTQAAPQQQPAFGGGRGWHQRGGDQGQGFAQRQPRSFGGGDGGGWRQRNFQAPRSAPQQVTPQGGGRNWGSRGGDGGGRGDRGGRGRRDRD